MKFVEVLRRAPNFSSIYNEFNYTEDTIKQWLTGNNLPHPKTQRMIMVQILNESQVPCDCETHRCADQCTYHSWFETT